jgi:uncharacterized protein (UPF0210 family)
MPAEATMLLGRLSASLLCVLPLAGITAAQNPQPAVTVQPKIRTITAFVRLDRSAYRAQVEDALKMLRAAKAEFTKAGYEVETIRITSQPFPEYISGLSADQALEFFHQYDKLAQQEGFTPDIGPAMSKDSDDPTQADLLARILASTESLNSFIVVADEQGIHWNAIQAAAKVIKSLEQTARSEGNFRFAAGAFPPQNAPFFPVSSTRDAGHGFAIGLESANVVNGALVSARGDLAVAGDRLTTALTAQAKRVEEIALRLEKQSGWKYQGIDLTPVPLKDVSIGAAMESALGAPLGSPGSLSVAYAITSAVRRVPVQQTGYSGLMLPVLEDSVLAQRWEAGAISRDALMSYSSVCSTGLDAVPLPGDTSQQELENIIADMASLAVKWHKPLSARLLPVTGKKGGEMTEFSSPYLANIHIR